MTLAHLLESNKFKVISEGTNQTRTLSKLFCCDLLSIAMGKAPADCVWVTVMGNINTLAVASLADASCIILAEGISLDEAALAKAKQQGLTVLSSEEPVFETALAVYEMMQQ